MTATPGRKAPVVQPALYSRPTATVGPVAPTRPAGNALHLGPRTRRVIRSVARLVNPLVLRIAGRRHMPVVGIIHHRGRKTGRPYATPLGIRPAAAGGFVMPLTFGEAAGWYRNILAAGWCVITWRGADHTVASPVIVDRATALPAFPRYERLALRAIGIDEFVWLHDASSLPKADSPAHSSDAAGRRRGIPARRNVCDGELGSRWARHRSRVMTRPHMSRVNPRSGCGHDHSASFIPFLRVPARRGDPQLRTPRVVIMWAREVLRRARLGPRRPGDGRLSCGLRCRWCWLRHLATLMKLNVPCHRSESPRLGDRTGTAKGPGSSAVNSGRKS